MGVILNGLDKRLSGFGGFDGVPLLAGEADSGKGTVVRKNYPAACVVPGVLLVLLEHGELDAVDGEQLVEGHAESHGGEHVELEQGLAALVIGTQRGLPRPVGGELCEAGGGERRGSCFDQPSPRKPSCQSSCHSGA